MTELISSALRSLLARCFYFKVWNLFLLLWRSPSSCWLC